MLGRREKHLEYSVTSLQDRLWVEGEVHFKVNQEDSLVNGLVVTDAVVVGVVILVNLSDGQVKMTWATFLKVKRRAMNISGHEDHGG